MDHEIIKLLIQNLPSILSAIFAGVSSIIGALGWRNARKAKLQSKENAEKLETHNDKIITEIKEVKKIVNGNTEKLLKDSQELHFIKGQEENKEKENK